MSANHVIERSFIDGLKTAAALEKIYQHVVSLNLPADDTIEYWDSGWKNSVKSIRHDEKGGWNGGYRTNLPAAINGRSAEKRPAADKPAAAAADKPAAKKSKNPLVVEVDPDYPIIHISAGGSRANVNLDGTVYAYPGSLIPLNRAIVDCLTDAEKFVRQHVARETTYTLLDITVTAESAAAAKTAICNQLAAAADWIKLQSAAAAEVVVNPCMLDAWLVKFGQQSAAAAAA